LQSPRSEGSRSACTPPSARPTYVSDSVAVDRKIMRGSAIPAPNGLPYLSIPVSASPDEGNKNRRSSCVSGQGRVTVFERGSRDFGLQDAGALLRTPTPPNPLLPRTQRSAQDTAADTQSICGAARHQPAASSCSIFSIGHAATHRGMAKAESCHSHRQALRLRFVMVRQRAGGWHDIKLIARISANAT